MNKFLSNAALFLTSSSPYNTLYLILRIHIRTQLTPGPRRMNINLVGTGTSVKSPNIVASCNLIKHEIGFSKLLISPTKILEVSAPGGSFFMKCAFI